MKLTEVADEVYENVRAINHATIGPSVLAAPTVYAVAGSLKAAGFGLEQALGQLAAALLRSLDVLEVTEDDGADPAPRAQAAAGAMREAAQHAAAMGHLLERAQQSISRQAYRRPVVVDELEDLEG